MAFWSDAEHTDPKRQYRFKVDIGISGVKPYVVKKVDKPSYAITEAEHKYLNHTYYYPGRVTWNAITMTLVDPGGGDDVARSLTKLIQDSGYNPQNASTSQQTMSKKSAVANLGSVVITQLDANGNPLETWTLINAWINDVKYGDLAYDGDELTEVTLSFKYDWAELKIGETPAAFKR